MRDISTKVDGVSTLSAAEFNDIPTEIENAVLASGQALSSGDLFQLSKSIASYVSVGDYYTESGAANAYILSTTGAFKAPTAYVTGMIVRFKPGNVNTGASTINVASLGVKNIKNVAGSADPTAGDLPAGRDVTLVYDGTNFRNITNTSVPTGTVFQAKQTTKTSTFVTTSTSYVDVTGLSVSITPTSASNKIMVIASVNGSSNDGGTAGGGGIQIVRGSTAIGVGDVNATNLQASSTFAAYQSNHQSTAVVVWIDSPATTSSTTYKVQANKGGSGAAGNGIYINGGSPTTGTNYTSTVSTITVMEIQA